jgi:type III secretory pathway lipoprotein EscJ
MYNKLNSDEFLSDYYILTESGFIKLNNITDVKKIKLFGKNTIDDIKYASVCFVRDMGVYTDIQAKYLRHTDNKYFTQKLSGHGYVNRQRVVNTVETTIMNCYKNDLVTINQLLDNCEERI